MQKQLNGDEEYLDVNELCNRIKYKKQTIYNKIYKNEFVKGYHFIKPSRKKLLFKWNSILDWLGEDQYNGIVIDKKDNGLNKKDERQVKLRKHYYDKKISEQCLIKI